MPAIDTDAINAAIQQLAVDGYATLSFGGESITVKSVAVLIQARDALAGANANSKPHFGMQFVRGGQKRATLAASGEPLAAIVDGGDWLCREAQRWPSE